MKIYYFFIKTKIKCGKILENDRKSGIDHIKPNN